MNNDRQFDDDTLLAYRDGTLDDALRREVESRVNESPADRARLDEFDRDVQLLKNVAETDFDTAPSLYAIRRRVARSSARRVTTRAAAVAATAAFFAIGFSLSEHASRIPTSVTVSTNSIIEVELLEATVAQLQLEVELLRAQSTRAYRDRLATHASAASPRTIYADASSVLLESARYWDVLDPSSAMSLARYEEILTYFPDSSAAEAAADATHSKEGNLQ